MHSLPSYQTCRFRRSRLRPRIVCLRRFAFFSRSRTVRNRSWDRRSSRYASQVRCGRSVALYLLDPRQGVSRVARAGAHRPHAAAGGHQRGRRLPRVSFVLPELDVAADGGGDGDDVARVLAADGGPRDARLHTPDLVPRAGGERVCARAVCVVT